VTSPQSTAKQLAWLADASVIQSVTSFLSGFDDRYTGSQGSLGAISYIQGFLRQNCSINAVYLDNFTFNDQGTLIQASNIVAKVEAANQTSKTLLVTAHHDSIGYQYPFNVYSTGAKGSDDDSSGVGAVLETARIVSTLGQDLKYNVLFVIFAAEEGNKTTNQAFMQEGSRHWISSDHLGVNSLQDIIGVVNLDGVAYKSGGPIGTYHHKSGSSVAENITLAASILGILAEDEGHARTDVYLKQVRCRTEDTFDSAGIPAVTLSTHYSNPFTHTPQDSLSNLDFREALNFTRTVLSYVCLTCVVTPKHEETYTAGWVSTICPQGQHTVNETNYIDVLIRPCTLVGYQLIVLDPSLAGIDSRSLLSITLASDATGRSLPILALGRVGANLLHLLAGSEVESIEQYSLGDDLIVHVNSSLTGLSHHPIYSYPNNIAFTNENGTSSSYKVIMGEAITGSNCCYCLARDTIGASTPFLQLSYTPYVHELWSWLGVLHTHNSSCGPIAFIGADNATTLTFIAQKIVENVAYWLLNAQRTAVVVEPSESSPLVGDRLKLEVVLRDSLTWSANSSIPVSLKVSSPSGKLLLTEVQVTGQDGVAESSNIFLTEIGEYQVSVTTFAGGGIGALATVTSFETGPRIGAYCDSEISVAQGESASIQLNLSYIPTIPETMVLTLRGKPLPSDLSIGMVFIRGYNNVNLTIPTREVIPPGTYSLTLTVMPPTREYVACEQLIVIFVTPGYDLEIIQAPDAMVQGSLSQLIVQLTSRRTIPVNGRLRVDSTDIVVKGETSFSISAGQTQQITLQIEETSTSPYCWGRGEMKITLMRDNSPVVESQPLPIFVSPNPINIFLGYILPPSLLLTIFIERLRKTNVKRAGIGTLLGGSILFLCGLAISQSMFLAVPLVMMAVGSYLATVAVEYVYDKPLPKGYEWLTPPLSNDGKVRNNRRGDDKRS
jgi:hypothetical protein